MNDRLPFNPLQAQEVATAFANAKVEYLFIGKGGAILLGFPVTGLDLLYQPVDMRACTTAPTVAHGLVFTQRLRQHNKTQHNE